MKRRYKQGDWIRVPLGGEHDALALLTQACRSRLFGYFFAVPAAFMPAHEYLRRLKPQDAIAVMLFGGAPIENARWSVVATSLPFDTAAWPFPDFGSRGAFGEAWRLVRYDPQTLQIVERRVTDRETAASLPDARFAEASEAEAILRRRILGEPSPPAESVCEVRSPVQPERLRGIELGGRIQFSTPLNDGDLAVITEFLETHPAIELRVHGFRHGFDANALARMRSLRRLVVDVHRLQHADALRSLRALERLHVGRMQIDLDFLAELAGLRVLHLRGTRGDLAPLLSVPHLRELVLEGTAPIDVLALASAQTLENIVLSHGEYGVEGLHVFKALRRLELPSLDIDHLPELSACEALEVLALHDLTRVRDIAPLAGAPRLKELRISEMPHLNVDDFIPIRRCAGLRAFDVDVGSRRKEREIYRLIKGGNT